MGSWRSFPTHHFANGLQCLEHWAQNQIVDGYRRLSRHCSSWFESAWERKNPAWTLPFHIVEPMWEDVVKTTQIRTLGVDRYKFPSSWSSGGEQFYDILLDGSPATRKRLSQ